MAQVPVPSPSSFVPQELREQLGVPKPCPPVTTAPSSGGKPQALRTFVRMTGVISLPEKESAELQKAMGKLSDSLMQLTELQNDHTMPDTARGEELFFLMPETMKCVAEIIQLGGVQLNSLHGTYNDEGIAKHKHAFELQQHLTHLYVQPASCQDCVKSSDDVRMISSLVLGVIENVMEIFGISDRQTVDRMKERVGVVKDTVNEICQKFIMDKDPAQTADYIATNREAYSKLVELSNRYSMFMTDIVRAFMNRMQFLPTEIVRNELNTILLSLRDLTPKFLLVAQGKLVEPGIVDKLLGAVDEGLELAKMVPRFTARIELEYIGGGTLEMTCAALRNSVCGRIVPDIGATARAYALEVSNVVAQCRQMGVSAVDCDEVQRALANVVKLAKAAVLSGNPEDVQKFEAAIEELNKLVGALPSKFKMVFYDESSNAFDAAKELLNTGLTDFVSSMQQ